MTHHRDGHRDVGPGEIGRGVGEVTASGVTVGAGRAWSRATVVAGATVLVSILVLTIILGPASPYGAGRVTGRFVPAYVITSVIATVRPRYRSWGRIVTTFFSVFFGMFLLSSFGLAVDGLDAS